MPTCFKLLRHWMRLALSLALARAGNNIAARIAMMAITTSSSINVNPAEHVFVFPTKTFTGLDGPMFQKFSAKSEPPHLGYYIYKTRSKAPEAGTTAEP